MSFVKGNAWFFLDAERFVFGSVLLTKKLLIECRRKIFYIFPQKRQNHNGSAFFGLRLYILFNV